MQPAFSKTFYTKLNIFKSKCYRQLEILSIPKFRQEVLIISTLLQYPTIISQNNIVDKKMNARRLEQLM